MIYFGLDDLPFFQRCCRSPWNHKRSSSYKCAWCFCSCWILRSARFFTQLFTCFRIGSIMAQMLQACNKQRLLDFAIEFFIRYEDNGISLNVSRWCTKPISRWLQILIRRTAGTGQTIIPMILLHLRCTKKKRLCCDITSIFILGNYFFEEITVADIQSCLARRAHYLEMSTN